MNLSDDLTYDSLFVDLDPDLPNAPSSNDNASFLSFPTHESEEFENVDFRTLELETVINDRSGKFWIWRECLCGHPSCNGKVLRPVFGRLTMEPQDRGRFEGGEE